MIRLISWLVDAFVLFLLIRMVLQLLAGVRGVSNRRGSSPGVRGRATERLGGTLVRDPQCGTYVPESGAVRLRTDRETLYFCSSACRDAYQRRA